MSEVKSAVVLGAARTAIGRFGGSLKDVPLEDLGALVISTAAQRAGVDAEDDPVIGVRQRPAGGGGRGHGGKLEAWGPVGHRSGATPVPYPTSSMATLRASSRTSSSSTTSTTRSCIRTWPPQTVVWTHPPWAA